MPSRYQAWCRSDPFDARLANLEKARSSPDYHPPRPWRSKEESHMVRRFVWQWYTCRDRNKPSGRAWARALGISHTWLQKLVREFQADPTATQRKMLRHGDPTLEQLTRALEQSRRMRERGELRPLLRTP
jgi:hypothetical protein